MTSLYRIAMMLLALAGFSLSAMSPAHADVVDPQACFANSDQTTQAEEGEQGKKKKEKEGEAEEDPDCE